MGKCRDLGEVEDLGLLAFAATPLRILPGRF